MWGDQRAGQGVWGEPDDEQWEANAYPHDLSNQYDIRDILRNAWEPRCQQDVVPTGALETFWRTHMTDDASEQLHPVVYEEIRRMLSDLFGHVKELDRAFDRGKGEPSSPPEPFTPQPEVSPDMIAAQERARAHDLARIESKKQTSSAESTNSRSEPNERGPSRFPMNHIRQHGAGSSWNRQAKKGSQLRSAN